METLGKDFKTFEASIGIEFNDAELLRQAFTHRSYLNEHRGASIGHNERLEFLGDAVLELIATHFLYEKFPEKDEGELTAFRAALVNAVTLSEVAQEIGMNDYLLLSRGEAKDQGRARGVLLANAIHHRSDAYSSVVAFFAILGTWFFPAFPLDPIGGKHFRLFIV